MSENLPPHPQEKETRWHNVKQLLEKALASLKGKNSPKATPSLDPREQISSQETIPAIKEVIGSLVTEQNQEHLTHIKELIDAHNGVCLVGVHVFANPTYPGTRRIMAASEKMFRARLATAGPFPVILLEEREFLDEARSRLTSWGVDLNNVLFIPTTMAAPFADTLYPAHFPSMGKTAVRKRLWEVQTTFLKLLGLKQAELFGQGFFHLGRAQTEAEHTHHEWGRVFAANHPELPDRVRANLSGCLSDTMQGLDEAGIRIQIPNERAIYIQD